MWYSSDTASCHQFSSSRIIMPRLSVWCGAAATLVHVLRDKWIMCHHLKYYSRWGGYLLHRRFEFITCIFAGVGVQKKRKLRRWTRKPLYTRRDTIHHYDGVYYKHRSCTDTHSKHIYFSLGIMIIKWPHTQKMRCSQYWDLSWFMDDMKFNLFK